MYFRKIEENNMNKSNANCHEFLLKLPQSVKMIVKGRFQNRHFVLRKLIKFLDSGNKAEYILAGYVSGISTSLQNTMFIFGNESRYPKV